MTKLLTALTALALAVPALGSGQDTLVPAGLEIDRAELMNLLERYEALAQSTAYSDRLREDVRVQTDMIRERLSMGDFRVGDRIALMEEGTMSSDTLIVEAGPLIDVPTLGPILLRGVLRSELEAHLAREMGRFIQNPIVRANALIRVLVLGVGRPGFYMLAPDTPLSDAVRRAGGSAGSDPDQIRIERGQDVLWSVEDLVSPLTEGRTLDELGIQAGDRIISPAQTAGGGGFFQSQVRGPLIQTVTWLVIPALIGFIR